MKTIKALEKEDYICITDIAKYKNAETTGLIISHWLSTRFTVEFMGFWEKIHNPDFNVTEFRNIKNQSGSNGFVLTVKQWVQKTNAMALIEGLEGRADYDGDHNIDIKELDLYVTKRVKALTSGSQHPTTEIPKTMPNFPVVVR